MILWPLSQTSSLAPSRPASLPPSLPATTASPPPHPCFSFFPPVLPGIKTSIHAPEDTHSRGERKRDVEGGGQGGGGGVKVGRFLRITAIRPKAQNCVLFLWVFFFFCTWRALPQPMPRHPRSGGIYGTQCFVCESWWESLEVGLRPTFPLMD